MNTSGKQGASVSGKRAGGTSESAETSTLRCRPTSRLAPSWCTTRVGTLEATVPRQSEGARERDPILTAPE